MHDDAKPAPWEATFTPAGAHQILTVRIPIYINEDPARSGHHRLTQVAQSVFDHMGIVAEQIKDKAPVGLRHDEPETYNEFYDQTIPQRMEYEWWFEEADHTK
jgi:hypothetical protein